ncbi:MAG TPA: hypothetical protein VN030_12270 [Cellvibrio sp.]|nr:hypothetical protein [Cellvibrio sp.]
MKKFIFAIAALGFALSAGAAEDNNIEVDTTRIKANKELPKVLYVVPWKEMENSKNNDQKLVLNDFFGDLYDPVLPSDKAVSYEQASSLPSGKLKQ